ncbi:hypothetical protein GCM10028801_31090 [Nocardioides maradonensis]
MAGGAIIEGAGKGAMAQKSGGEWAVGPFLASWATGYEVATEGRQIKSGVGGAVVGVVALGPLGLAGGLLGARKKRLSVVTWRDGQESLVEITSPDLHSALTRAAFANRNAR